MKKEKLLLIYKNEDTIYDLAEECMQLRKLVETILKNYAKDTCKDSSVEEIYQTYLNNYNLELGLNGDLRLKYE